MVILLLTARVHIIEESVLLQYDLSKLNTYSMMYGFSTNTIHLKGVKRQDWNSV